MQERELGTSASERAGGSTACSVFLPADKRRQTAPSAAL